MFAFMFNLREIDNKTITNVAIDAETTADAWKRIYERYLRASGELTLEKAEIVSVKWAHRPYREVPLT